MISIAITTVLEEGEEADCSFDRVSTGTQQPHDEIKVCNF